MLRILVGSIEPFVTHIYFESESVVDSDSPEIRKGMKFNSLPELQFFLDDYAVRHHRPFNVVHSDKRVQ